MWGGHSCPPLLIWPLVYLCDTRAYSATQFLNEESTSKAADESVRPTMVLLLVSPLRFPHDGGETTATEIKSLLDTSADSNSGAVARHAVSLAENPHPARTIVNFKDSGAECAEGSGHVARNGDFFPDIASGIAINSLDAGARGASSQNQASCNDQ